MKIGNLFVTAILRSPFHSLLSGNVMLVTFTGRKSGQIYTTPVNYVRDDSALMVLSQDDRTWWKNLRGGASVTLRLQGQDQKAQGEVLEDPQAVTEGLLFLLQRVPNLRNYFHIDLTGDGQPADPDALAQLAYSKVIIRFTELEPA